MGILYNKGWKKRKNHFFFRWIVHGHKTGFVKKHKNP